jgi:tetratricopeptide (TPR) repeat protein
MPGIEEAERALELADEASTRMDVEAVVAHVSSAIRGFTAAGDNKRAAMACVRLGDVFANAMGNLTASRAWFCRARRLVADLPPCLEQGWVAVAAMGCDVNDPATLLVDAELALDRARRFGDLNLETKALADGGLAHVQAGRIAEGMALLDEAMALACGPADDASVAAKSVCSFFTACFHAGDFGRASDWAGLLERHGLIGRGPGPPIFLSSHCDSVRATLLVELGRWGDAEAMLNQARADFEAVMPFPSWHPDIALADLRIRQGRLAEAEELLLGKDQSMQALLPIARLHVARGDHELAAMAARRGLRVAADDRLRAVELLVALVCAELGRGDLERAAEAADDLAARACDLAVPALKGRAAAARSRARAAAGDTAGALALVSEAVDQVDPAALPWLHFTLLVELARALDANGDSTDASHAATDARRELAALDVVVTEADAALLDRLAGSERRAGAESPATMTRDRRGFVLAHAGTTTRLPDTQGLRYLAELVRQPGREHHALDLVDRVEGVDIGGGVDRRALGSAGDLTDGQARAEYRRRIERLRADIEDAIAEGRFDAAEAMQSEIEQLVGGLARAFGLGGRSRQAASAAERARLNVTRAIRTAIDRITDLVPAGRVLDQRVRTGLYCAYEPRDDDRVRWIVQS